MAGAIINSFRVYLFYVLIPHAQFFHLPRSKTACHHIRPADQLPSQFFSLRRLNVYRHRMATGVNRRSPGIIINTRFAIPIRPLKSHQVWPRMTFDPNNRGAPHPQVSDGQWTSRHPAEAGHFYSRKWQPGIRLCSYLVHHITPALFRAVNDALGMLISPA